MKKLILSTIICALLASTAAQASNVTKDAYIKADIGRDIIVGNKDTNGESVKIEHFSMLEVGATLSYEKSENLALTAESIVQYGFGGADDIDGKPFDNERLNLHKLTIGIDTVAGSTSVGKQCSTASYFFEGFGSALKTNNIGKPNTSFNCGDALISHVISGDYGHLSANYDNKNKEWGSSGRYKISDKITVGAAYIGSTESDINHDNILVGAEFDHEQLSLATRATTNESFDNSFKTYSVSGDYDLTHKLNIALELTMTEAENEDNKFEDEFGTVGLTYSFSENATLYSQYKFGSENDDNISLRAVFKY